MNILSDFSDTLVSSITALYVLITFTVILFLRNKLCKAKSIIDSLRIQHVYTVKPNHPAPPPPHNPSGIEFIFDSNLQTIHRIQSLIKMFFARLEKEHRQPTPHELQYLHSMRHIISTLEMVENSIVYRWEAYTKNIKPENEEQKTS